MKSFTVLVRCSTDYIYIIMSFVLCYYNAHKVHGFVNATYDVVEEDRLFTSFQLNVKGETAYPTLYFRGTIFSDAAGTASKSHENVKIIFWGISYLSIYIGSSDFQSVILDLLDTNNEEIRIFTINDDITLEYNDSIILVFIPDDPALIPGLEAAGEYIRDTATINIIDDDSKCFEGDSITC